MQNGVLVQPTPEQFAADSKAEQAAVAAHQSRARVAVAAPVLSDEARAIAYATGIRQLAPLVDRLIAAERSLQAVHSTLDSQVAIISRLVERIAVLEGKRK